MKTMCVKRNTREKILSEAFSLCEDFQNSKFSLSEIASRVGISKTAIFRHFKNKDALIQEMKDIFFNDLSLCLNKREYFFSKEEYSPVKFEEFSLLLDDVMSLFLEKPAYIGFAVNFVIMNKSPEQSMFELLSKNGVKFSESYTGNKSISRFYKAYFCTESLIFFLSRRACMIKLSEENVPAEDVFKKNVIQLLWSGLSGDDGHLTPERIAELDKVCEINLESGSGEDTRFFKAFAEVFNEYGIEGITIEKISERLNLAKSSLYSFFNNKEEFIGKMLASEMSMIMKIISEKISVAKSEEEMAYILMRAEKNYLEMRPFVLMIHSWASQQGFSFERMRVNKEVMKETEENISFLMSKEFESKYEFSTKTLLGWISSVMGALKMYFNVTKFKVPEQQMDYAMELFSLVNSGISTR